MSPYEIRLARPEDDAAVGELLVMAFVDTYARKMPEVVVTEARKQTLRDVAGKRAVARVFVATRHDEIVGSIALWPPGAEGSEAWLPASADLRHLAVKDGHRGGEVSRLLMDAALDEARRLGTECICLHVRQGAHGLRRLYESRGFVRAPEGDIDRRPELFLEGFALGLG